MIPLARLCAARSARRKRSDGSGMGADRAVSPGAEVSGALPDDRSAGGDERDPVSGLVRLPVVARQAIARQSAKKGGRMLPKDFPPVSTVQGYFYAWRNGRLWTTISHALVMAAREAAWREASPSAGVIHHDRQPDDLRADLEVAEATAHAYCGEIRAGAVALKPVLTDRARRCA